VKKAVSFYSEGMRLVGDVYYPDGAAPSEPRAGIMLCHGYTGVKDRVVDRIAPQPVLFITTDDDRLMPPEESFRLCARAGEPNKLVVLRGYGHYEVYAEPAFGEVMQETVVWYGQHLPARTT
jgi:pimeloyl-ACP methyl ester carboxylesterase